MISCQPYKKGREGPLEERHSIFELTELTRDVDVPFAVLGSLSTHQNAPLMSPSFSVRSPAHHRMQRMRPRVDFEVCGEVKPSRVFVEVSNSNVNI